LPGGERAGVRGERNSSPTSVINENPLLPSRLTRHVLLSPRRRALDSFVRPPVDRVHLRSELALYAGDSQRLGLPRLYGRLALSVSANGAATPQPSPNQTPGRGRGKTGPVCHDDGCGDGAG